MKAVEFETRLNPDRTLTVPEGLAAAMPPQQMVRVLVLIPEENEDVEERDWKLMAAMQFGKGYAESDDIYDQLSAQ